MTIHNCSPLSPVEIQFIAERIVTDWEKIVRLLLLSEKEIENTKVVYGKPSQQAFQALKIWSRHMETPCFCKVTDVLKRAGRYDVSKEFEQEYVTTGGITSPRCLGNYNFTSVPHFVGRKDEIRKIKDFLKMEQTDCQLCNIVGLPGVGKTETLNEALKGEDRNKIVRPQFTTNVSKTWTNEDLLDCIINKWRIVINYKIQAEEAPFDVLNKINQGVILVLEVANLKYNVTRLYNFIHKLLRIESNKLKIIITASTHPPQTRVQSVTINLSELNKQDSLQLLKKMNSDLEPNHCEILFHSCGGNPFILREVMNKLKQKPPSQWENYIQRYKNYNDAVVISTVIGTTEWKRFMVNLFDSLEDNEKDVLVKIAAFDGNIPQELLECLFDRRFIVTLEHLCDSHSILKRVEKNSFHLSTPIKAFIIDHISEIGLGDQYESAQRKRTKHCLSFLTTLVKSFFSKNPEGKLFLKKKYCCFCKAKCSCAHSKRCLNIFYKCKDVFVQSICHGFKHDNYQREAIETFTEAVLFLRHCLSHEEFIDLMNKIDSMVSLESLDEISQAVMVANLTFVKYFDNKFLKKKLELSIDCLTAHKDNLQPYQQKLLLKCKIKKLWIEAIYCKSLQQQPNHARDELLELKENMSEQEKIECSISGVLADVFCQERDYGEALQYRIEQVRQNFHYLGNHPITANSLYLLGKLHENLNEQKLAKKSYKSARNMYKKLQIHGKVYANCLSSLGRLGENSKVNERYFRDATFIIRHLLACNRCVSCKRLLKKVYAKCSKDCVHDNDKDDYSSTEVDFANSNIVDFQFSQLHYFRQTSQNNFQQKWSQKSDDCHRNNIAMFFLCFIIFGVFPFFVYLYISTEL